MFPPSCPGFSPSESLGLLAHPQWGPDLPSPGVAAGLPLPALLPALSGGRAGDPGPSLGRVQVVVVTAHVAPFPIRTWGPRLAGSHQPLGRQWLREPRGAPSPPAQALCLPGPRPGSLIPVNLPRMPLGCGSALSDGASGRSSSFQSSTRGRETSCVDLGSVVSLRWCYSRSNWSTAREAGFAGGRG